MKKQKKKRIKKETRQQTRLKRIEKRVERAPWARVGVVAPSAPAPWVELERGAQRLQAEGFEVFLHPQVKSINGMLAGSDEERAIALLDYAFDPDLDVIWAARGGYGAVRMLETLEKIGQDLGVPEKKTYVGFSDSTIILEYVRKKWGWRAIHGPMPATFHIERVKGKDWKSFVELLQGKSAEWKMRLDPVYVPHGFNMVKGELVGGNLAMIQSVIGTRFQLELKDKILFLEEIGEAPYRIDRMLRQLLLSGSLNGVRGIVLGTLTDCNDVAPQVYSPSSSGSKTKKTRPLRKELSESQFVAGTFGDLGRTLDIPVFRGFPVGHGTGTRCFEVGVRVSLSRSGEIILES